ncbi:MAG: hypothetical protein ACQBVK_02400 [Candidatus Phytoplasma sp. TWB_XP]
MIEEQIGNLDNMTISIQNKRVMLVDTLFSGTTMGYRQRWVNEKQTEINDLESQRQPLLRPQIEELNTKLTPLQEQKKQNRT